MDRAFRRALNAARLATFLCAVASAQTCNEIGADQTSCLRHTEVKFHTCSFCVTDNACHEVGSRDDPCTKDCCASHSHASTCRYDDVSDVNTTACSGIWSAKAFAPGFGPASPNSTWWPEKGRTNGKGTSLHFSGGGSRALTAAVGQVCVFVYARVQRFNQRLA